MESMEPQSKRKRRPSVRLGEIGYAGPDDASELWIEAPRQRRKSSVKKPPRIRPLEHVAGDKAVVEEEWSVDEPAVASADDEKVAADGEGGVTTPVKEPHVRRRSGLTARKPNSKVRGKGLGGDRLAWQGSKVRWKHEEVTRVEAAVDADSPENREEDEEEEKERFPLQANGEAPFLAGTSSDSEELMGSGLKEDGELPGDDSGNGASDRSEEGDAGANPNSPCNSHLGLNMENGSAGGVTAMQQRCMIIIPANPNSNGDEMQGAIEDGPGQANGKGFSAGKQREGERRSGRQAARRNAATRDIISRDIAGEQSGRFQAAPAGANGTIVAIPSSSQRVTSLSAGVSGWLQDLGLGKYSELFELNEVDTEVLPLLTMDDLREMGVDAVGARRKMFTNIQELGQLRGP